MTGKISSQLIHVKYWFNYWQDNHVNWFCVITNQLVDLLLCFLISPNAKQVKLPSTKGFAFWEIDLLLAFLSNGSMLTNFFRTRSIAFQRIIENAHS